MRATCVRDVTQQLRDRIASDLVIRARLVAERLAASGLRLANTQVVDAEDARGAAHAAGGAAAEVEVTRPDYSCNAANA
jgi:hypothetical protein